MISSFRFKPQFKKLYASICLVTPLLLAGVHTQGFAADQSAYQSPVTLPGTLHAEKYDRGGENVAYHDTSAGNTGNQLRNDNVDIEEQSGGGHNVSWISPGEWLEFTVNVTEPGVHKIKANVASLNEGGSLHIEANGNSSPIISFTATGDWQNWQETDSVDLNLSTGEQVIRVVVDSGSFNLDTLSFTSGGIISNQQPFHDSPANIPGTIRAEDYDKGGEGIAYHDDSDGNFGGANVRAGDSVDIEAKPTGGHNVGWISPGEWLEYTVDVKEAGEYNLTALIASDSNGGTIAFEFTGATNTNATPITFGGTNGWQVWVNSPSTKVNLNQGQHVIRLVSSSGEFNIDEFTLTKGGVIDDIESYPGYTGQYQNFTLSVDERFDTFDTQLWSTGDGAVGKEGDCRFQIQGVQMRNGVMELTVNEEHIPSGYSNDHQAQKRAYEYSCGELRTNDEYLYGRLEARFRTPSTPSTGFISSLFTYDTDNDTWRELDVELEGGRPGSMQSNYIFGNDASTWNHEWQATRTWGAWEALHPTPKATSEWTVHAIEWTPDYVAWFMDGQEVRRLTNSDLDGNPMVGPQIKAAWLPENRTKIMMNFWIPTPEVGVNFGGHPGGNQYPMTAHYDWFRYYEYTPSGDPDSDNDGVIDRNDNCPNTPANTPVDSVGCPIPSNASVKVMTFNVRTEEANDPGEKNWMQRRNEVIQTINQQHPEILGLQEATGSQHDFIKGSLGANWASSSHRQFIYNQDVFAHNAGGLIFLVDDIWGTRTAEWGRMTHKTSGKEFVFLNSHWGVDANSQQGSANILRDELHTVNNNWTTPTILLGDFNATPNSGPIQTLVGQTPLTNYFSGNTFNGWNHNANRQLDYVVGHGITNPNCTLETYREGNHPPSDHFPIACQLTIN